MCASRMPSPLASRHHWRAAQHSEGVHSCPSSLTNPALAPLTAPLTTATHALQGRGMRWPASSIALLWTTSKAGTPPALPRCSATTGAMLRGCSSLAQRPDQRIAQRQVAAVVKRRQHRVVQLSWSEAAAVRRSQRRRWRCCGGCSTAAAQRAHPVPLGLPLEVLHAWGCFALEKQTCTVKTEELDEIKTGAAWKCLRRAD